MLLLVFSQLETTLYPLETLHIHLEHQVVALVVTTKQSVEVEKNATEILIPTANKNQ